jgi:hypothetical protein
VVVENYQDTWKYARYYGGESINQTLFDRLGLPANLPSDIGDLLFKAFEDTYTGVPHPERLPGDGFYTREQIDITYEVFYEVLRLMSKMAVERPEEPFSGVADILADALDAFSPPPSPPSSGSSCSWKDILSFGLTSSSRECYENFFEEVASWLNYLGELIVWSLETLRNLVDLLLSLLLSLPISVLLAILYGIQLLCYQIYRSARMVLATNGFVMPEPDELYSSIGRNLITLFQPCASNFKFPLVCVPVRNQLVCPVSPVEQPSTAVAFHPTGIGSDPDLFISGEPFSEDSLRMYALSVSPEETRSIERDRRSIGNAADFTAWMVQHANDSSVIEGGEEHLMLYRNWNLDGDRGYGYLAWKGKVPDASPFTVEDEDYKF